MTAKPAKTKKAPAKKKPAAKKVAPKKVAPKKKAAVKKPAIAKKKAPAKKKPVKKKSTRVSSGNKTNHGSPRPTCIGNQYHLMNDRPGRNKLLTPEEFVERAQAYFEWNHQNPWIKTDVIKSGERAGELLHIPVQRPLTESALCLHLCIDRSTWENYQSKAGYEEYFSICKEIKEIIRSQKFEGASVGVFNHAIIARDLGLTDKSEVSGANGGPVSIIERVIVKATN